MSSHKAPLDVLDCPSAQEIAASALAARGPTWLWQEADQRVGEKVLTGTVAQAVLAARRPAKIFVADVHSDLVAAHPTVTRAAQWQCDEKESDLAWSPTTDPSGPTSLVQVKMLRHQFARSTQPAAAAANAALALVSDCLYAAVECASASSPATHAAGVFFFPDFYRQGTAQPQPVLGLIDALRERGSATCAEDRRCTLVLAPTAQDVRVTRRGQRRDDAWARSTEMRPRTRADLTRIFGQGTNAKFVGLWARAGAIHLPLALDHAAVPAEPSWSGRLNVLVVRTGPVELRGAPPGVDLRRWLP